MTDAGRQDASDKIGAALKPEFQKSGSESLADSAKGALDSVASTLQPQGDKSTTQKATDSVTSGGDNKGYVDQAKDAVGLGGDKMT